MARLIDEYMRKAAREVAEEQKRQDRIDRINKKRHLDHPSGLKRPKFDGRTTKEVFETIRIEKRKP